MNREDKRAIFFGVVGVLTLIVAIIGASLAYFSISARSNDDAVRVEAASVQIVYEQGTSLAVDNIIPATQEVAVETFQRYLDKDEYKDPSSQEMVKYSKCIDDNGYEVCSVYNFTLTNNGPTATTITMSIEPTQIKGEDGQPLTHKMFKNLNYILYDITEVEEATYADGTDYNGLGTPLKSGPLSVVEEDGKVTGYNKTVILDYNAENTENNHSIAGNGTTKKYRLFVWLKETSTATENIPQDYEQGAMFQGAISIDVAGAENSQITGNADSTLKS